MDRRQTTSRSGKIEWDSNPHDWPEKRSLIRGKALRLLIVHCLSDALFVSRNVAPVSFVGFGRGKTEKGNRHVHWSFSPDT